MIIFYNLLENGDIMDKTVIELFAGVGGFRVGLNEITTDEYGNTIEKDNFKFVWANQWEPSTTTQDAYNCYVKHFGNTPNHSNIDISLVDKKSIPNHTLLVGGFPCQDYSVARSLSQEKGIEGKKGVLWWQINEILKVKKPPFILLENVDRLLKSPSKQRGRDFGIMLRCLNDLGYGVEWRVINAAEYGFPQKRRRIYIFGFHKSTNYYKKIVKNSIENIFNKTGIFAKTFKINSYEKITTSDISKESYNTLVEITNDFKFNFENSGIMFKNKAHTTKVLPSIKKAITLGQIIETENIPSECFITEAQEAKFRYLKGSKKIPRVSKLGIKYNYSEGAMCFPDYLNMPGRTMLTSEGTINRSTHVVKDIKTKRLRILTPVETERLNQFPDNWTNTGMTSKKRYFMMGNALICGIIKELGYQISNIIENEN